MKRIYVDFSRGETLQCVEIGYESDRDIADLHLCEGKRVVVEDVSLGVQGTVHAEQRDGERYWYAIPDWQTRQDYDDAAYRASA